MYLLFHMVALYKHKVSGKGGPNHCWTALRECEEDIWSKITHQDKEREATNGRENMGLFTSNNLNGPLGLGIVSLL